MVYGYIRVSTDTQTVENQRFEIDKYSIDKNIKIDSYIEETISGTKKYTKRELGKLLKKLKPGDILIATEISRLGRSLYMIMEIISITMEKGAKIVTIKDGFELKDNIESKVLAFAFGLSAEIERQLISQRTSEALKRKKAEGVILGRPKGTLRVNKTLLEDKDKIIDLVTSGATVSKIAKKYHLHYNTVRKFINDVIPEYKNNGNQAG